MSPRPKRINFTFRLPDMTENKTKDENYDTLNLPKKSLGKTNVKNTLHPKRKRGNRIR